MRKRTSRPPRFVAIDNGAVDTLRSMTAKGLLSTLLRAKDGDEVTVEALSKTHDEGRESLAKAMRVLVDHAFVVKFKVQRRRSEVVELADGKRETKRGGSWYTTFSVDSIAFTADDVAVMLDDVLAGGNVKAVRVEPEHLDPRATPERPTTGKPYVGPTCDETGKPQVGPTYGKPTVGQPTTGRAAAKKIKTGGEEDSLSGSRDSGDTPEAGREREAAAPDPVGADVVVDAYAQALGRPLVNGSRERLRGQAVQLLAAGYPVAWLAARAAEMPANGWRDLVQHAETCRVPIPGQAGPADAAAPGGEGAGTPEQVAALRARIAARGSGL
ncbi:hypothetical protein [Streptomyces marianii]|uniref:Uncharacterized protein n=1 Tax=Streptomyces marianii TaxID=1817406 RepID=A0A5R9DVB0_9ACTN|nr:hypothetical protein [Streptomyces marianii]TLQ38603.1 hypothetical protein FEF34_40905 [Streptomyces marianii]